ncbi:hypothetical protein [Mesorhizobium sp. WSM2239]|uniref:Uncharacterized protein n=2 Tax=unclassified Mesorhizobium TaxID=325217 RepID=A0AAU8DGU5_9HYPH
MSKILADLTQKPQGRQFARATVLVHDEGIGGNPGSPVGAKITGKRCPTGRWNKMSFPERVPTRPVMAEVRVSGGQRQLQPKRNPMRLYRPQDQRGVQTVFVIFDRDTGQELARVRGNASHCEIEAEKLARSQGCEFADLIVKFEGELDV